MKMKAKNKLAILQKAQENNEEPTSVLSELNIKINPYTLFVYDIALLGRRDSVENILKELKLVNTPEINKAMIFIIDNTRPYDMNDFSSFAYESPTFEFEGENIWMSLLIELLKKRGVRYIQPFQMYISNLFLDEDLPF